MGVEIETFGLRPKFSVHSRSVPFPLPVGLTERKSEEGTDDHFAEYFDEIPPHTREIRNWGAEGVAPFPAIRAEFAIHGKTDSSSPFNFQEFRLGMCTADTCPHPVYWF